VFLASGLSTRTWNSLESMGRRLNNAMTQNQGDTEEPQYDEAAEPAGQLRMIVRIIDVKNVFYVFIIFIKNAFCKVFYF